MNVLKKTFAVASAVSLVCLSSTGAMAANKLIVKDSTGTTDKFVVTDTGSLGIGTNAPDAAIHIKGAVFPTNVIKIEGDATNGGGGIAGYLIRTGGLPLLGERLGFIYFGSVNDQGSSPVPLHAAGMKAVAQGNWTTTSTPALFAFETTPSGSTTRVERMRITSDGNMGIGTTLPGQKLEVNGAIRLNTSTTKPVTCGATLRGTIWFTQGASGVADTLEVCAKDASNNYSWIPLF